MPLQPAGSAKVDGGGHAHDKDEIAFVFEVGRSHSALDDNLGAIRPKLVNSSFDGRSLTSQA